MSSMELAAALAMEREIVGRECEVVDHAYVADCLVLVYDAHGKYGQRRIATYRPDGTQVHSAIVWVDHDLPEVHTAQRANELRARAGELFGEEEVSP